MSYENVFEQWLKQKISIKQGEKDNINTDSEEEMSTDPSSDHTNNMPSERRMPKIHGEVWAEEDVKDMPVLQKMVDLPVPEGRKCSPPPPLQMTLSLKECRLEGKSVRRSRERSPQKDSLKTSSRLQDVAEEEVQKDEKQMTEDHVMDEKNRLPCHHSTKESALTELTDLSQGTSPAAPRGFEADVTEVLDHSTQDKVAKSHLTGSKSPSALELSKFDSEAHMLSPERDVPMEPDSTSESVAKWQRSQKAFIAARTEAVLSCEVSPRSTACSGGAASDGSNGGGSSCEVSVHVEEHLAECDSTSMFIASPSAISPASQGEIEERMCPVLTDHEDGASPAHCVCQCRSLPPPTDLVPRDHAPVPHPPASANSPATGSHHFGLMSIASNNTKCMSSSPLVSHKKCHDGDCAPDLEKMTPNLNYETKPASDVTVSENEHPPLLTLPEQEALEKQFADEHAAEDRHVATVTQQDLPPSLTKYGQGTTHSDRKEAPSDPPILTLNAEESTAKPAKKQLEMSELAQFDWDSAVAETVETPPSLTTVDGDSKPSIVLLIRKAGTPLSTLPSAEARPAAADARIRRNRHTCDSLNIMSRLRKRKPSIEAMQAEGKDCTNQKNSQDPSAGDCEPRGKRHKSERSSNPSCSKHVSSKQKRVRRSTVQLGCDLRTQTSHHSSSDRDFILFSTRLFRLQTLTYKLVNTLFPRLRPQLSLITPDSQRFFSVISDIVASLEHSESEENVKESEDVRSLMESLTLGEETGCVPVFSPQVMLCRSPQHSFEEFQDKVCCLLQLLLPDLTISLTESVSQTPDSLETVLKNMLIVNK